MSTTWEAKLAQAERRQEAEKVFHAIKEYLDAQESLSKAYSEFEGPSPGYFLSDQQDSVERRAVEALDAEEIDFVPTMWTFLPDIPPNS